MAGAWRDPVLLFWPATGTVDIREIGGGDPDSMHAVVLAVPDELQDRRRTGRSPAVRDDAWHAARAAELNKRC